MSNLTKQALSNSFVELLQNTSIENITVKSICEKCGVNRNTFYYHFLDIYDLMDWTLADRFKAYITTSPSIIDSTEFQIKLLIQFFKKEKRAILHAYDPSGHIYYESILQKQLNPYVLNSVKKYDRSQLLPEEDTNFISSAYTKIAVGLLLDWVVCGMPSYEEYSLQKMYLLLDEDVLKRAVDRFILAREQQIIPD